MSLNVASLMVTIGADTAMAQQSIMGLAQMLGSRGLLALGAAGAVAAVAGIGIAATKMAADFQTGLTSLVTGAGESASNLKLVSDGILKLATQTGTSTQQLIDGMYMIESAGFHGAAGLKILQAAAEGAKVGNADLGTVADATTTILKDYPNVVGGATGAVNLLIATVANGKTHMADLAGALSGILPTASAAGVGLNDVMAALATMTGEGVDAANATTYLRQLLLNLTAPSDAAKKALAAVGLTSDQVSAAMKKSLPDALKLIQDHLAATYGVGTPKYIAAMKDISGGTREIQGMLDLTGTHLATFEQNIGNVTGAVKKGGSAITGWSMVQGTFNQKMSVLNETFQTTMIRVGEKFLPLATKLADLLATHLPGAIDAVATACHRAADAGQNVIRFLNDSGPAATVVKGIILALSGALLGFAASAIPAAVAGILASVTAFGAQAIAAGAAAVATLAAVWPFLAVGAAIALVVGGILLLVQHWSQVQAFFGNVARAIGGFFSGLGTLVHTAVGAALGLIGNLLGMYFGLWRTIIVGGFTLIKNIVTGAIQAVLGIFSWLYTHNTYFKDMVDGIRLDLTILHTTVTTIITDVREFIVAKWLQITADAMAAWLLFQQYVVKPVQDLLTKIEGILTTVRTIIQAKWNELKADATAAWDKLVSAVVTAASGLWNQVWTRGLKPVLDGIEGLGGKLLSIGGTLIQKLLQGMLAGLKADGNIASNIGDSILNMMGFHGVSLPHFAAGGTMAETGLAVVGEHGPELVQLPAGARVYPNGSTPPLAGAGLTPLGNGSGGGTGPTQQTIVVQLDSKVLTQAVVKQMPNVVRVGTGTRHM